MQTTLSDKCYHCGDSCDSEALSIGDKYFCCVGCKTVYEILESSGLTEYYQLEQQPGISLNKPNSKGKFDYLSSETIQQELLTFRSDTKSIINFHIPVIHCSSCIWLLENLDRLIDGVEHTRVNFTKKEVTITFQSEVLSLVDLANFLSNIGYEPLITLNNSQKNNKFKQNHSIYLKLGIAGFCFGNIMLLAFPEYFGIDDVDSNLRQFFSYLSALLCLPVLYAGSDYLVSAYKGIRQGYFNIDIPISLGIIALLARSWYEVISGMGTGYFDSLAGLIFFLLIGKWFQSKTYEQLSFDRDYKSYFPLAVDRLVGINIVPTQVNRLTPKDEIIIKNNELIPADSTLLSKHAAIDYSFVTGESLPDHKQEGDYLYAGGRQQGVSIRLRVEKKVSQSYLTQLWNNEAFSKTKNEQKQLIDYISKYFTLIIISIAISSSLVWYWIEPSQIINVFTSVLIVACPCALALSAPFTLGNTLRVMGKVGFYLKNTQAIEQMSKISHLVLDKTGTITHNHQTDVKILSNAMQNIDFEVVHAMVSHSSHPLSKLLKEYLNSYEKVTPLSDFQEIAGKGLIATYRGEQYKVGSVSLLGIESENKVNGSEVHVSKSGIYLGSFQLANRYRNGLKQVIDAIKTNVGLTVLTGDNDSERKTLNQRFGITNFVYGKKPDEKLQFIKTLKAKGEVTMMIGDGLNDAGALQQSDVGLVIADDINNFTPASDGILDAKSLDKLPTLLRLSRVSRRIIYFSFVLSFLYNLIGLGFAVSGILTPVFAAILMPLSSVSVVVFATIAVHFSAKYLKLSS